MVWSVLGQGKCQEMQSLWAAYWSYMRSKSDDPAQDTEAQLWKAFAWDLLWLFKGQHPTEDWEGQPWPAESVEAQKAGQHLADGLAALPWLLKGDLDHFQKYLGLESTAGNNCCVFCPANRSTMPWTNFRDCQWMRLCFEAQAFDDWKRNHPSCHPCFGVLGLSQRSTRGDVQHTVALGAAQHAVGSTMWLLTHGPDFPGTVAARCKLVWEHVKQYYREHRPPCEVGKLVPSMYHHPGGYPEMTTKAKETEYLCSAVLWTWRQLANPDSQRDQSVEAMLQHLENIFDACRRRGPSAHMQDGAHEQLVLNVTGFLAQYTALGNHAERRGQKLWNVVPKFHVLWHIARQAKYLGPWVSACYVDESFMGIVKRLVIKCSAGVALENVAQTLVTKYLYNIMLMWAKHQRHELPWRHA